MEDAFSFVSHFGGDPNCDFIGLYDGHSKADAAIFAAKYQPDVLLKLLGSGSGEREHEAASSSSAAVEASASSKIHKAIEKSFPQVNDLLREAIAQDPSLKHCGSTGVFCLFKDGVCFTANVGDSRAVLCRSGEVWRK